MTRASARTSARFVVLLLGAAVMVLPFAMMLATAFKGQSYVLSPSLVPDHPTLDNYVRAWTSNGFGRYFLNSAVVALSTVALVLLLGSMMAYAFARFEFAGKKALFYAMIATLMIPGMMLLIPQYFVARDLGVLDSLAGKTVILGVLDLSTDEVETPETVEARIRRAFPHTRDLIAAPDCGIKYLPRASAFGKLEALVEGARRAAA